MRGNCLPLQSFHRLLNVPPCSNRQTGQRVSVREIRYRKQAPTVRNMRAVLKKASWGTRCIFRGIRCKKQAFLVRKGYSVRKTGFCGTRRIFKGTRCAKKASLGTRSVFKGAQNSTCYIERIFKGAQNSRLHRLWTASCRTGRIFRGVPCQKQHLPTGRIFSARNAHRSLCSLRRPLPLLLRRHSGPETPTARR